MLKENNNIIRRVEQFADLGLTALSFFAAYYLRSLFSDGYQPLKHLVNYLFLLYMIIPAWAFLLYYYGAYGSIRTKPLSQALAPVLKSVVAGGALLMTALFIFRLEAISRGLLFIFLALNASALGLFRVFIYALTHYIRKKGYNYRSVLIVGTGERAEEFARVLDGHKEWGVKALGFLEHASEPSGKRPVRGKVIGHMKDIQDIVTAHQVDEVVFVVPRDFLDKIEDAVLICEKIGIKASIAADLYPHTIAKTSIEDMSGWPLLAFNPAQHLSEALVLKRVLDIAFSSAMLIITGPFLLAALIGVKLSSPGPVFFAQERCGLNGRRFRLLKFRTMVQNADEIKNTLAHLNEMSGPVFKMKNDPRVTAFGRFLRKYSLDELPQFINVLRGDMSIVGPRPPLPSEVEKYDLWQRRRLSVRPGITCFWQISGRNKIGFNEWMKLDLEYIDKWSFGLDLKIILKTVPAVLKGTGL